MDHPLTYVVLEYSQTEIYTIHIIFQFIKTPMSHEIYHIRPFCCQFVLIVKRSWNSHKISLVSADLHELCRNNISLKSFKSSLKIPRKIFRDEKILLWNIIAGKISTKLCRVVVVVRWKFCQWNERWWRHNDDFTIVTKLSQRRSQNGENFPPHQNWSWKFPRDFPQKFLLTFSRDSTTWASIYEHFSIFNSKNFSWKEISRIFSISRSIVALTRKLVSVEKF